MTDVFVEDFLAGFDDSRFPAAFLQRYELMECLSQNEIGETFLVKERQTGMYYVAKCYAKNTFPSGAAEGDLLRKLNHHGLPVYISEHQNEEMLCIVRSYAQGQSLAELALDGPLGQQQAIMIGTQLCEILAYLHSQNPPIIHRDVKPQNIIVDEHGLVTLIDFGISRTFDETAQEDTLCLGTRHYAAPEQYGFAQTDPRSDIFSLGVLLLWLLTGKTNTRQARELLPNSWLTHVIGRCIAFNPEARYQTAAQLRDALTGRAIRRRRLLSFIAASLFILASAFALFNFSWGKNWESGIVFKEPLLEEAVRMKLGKGASDMLSEQDLATIEELYVYGNQAAGEQELFDTYAHSFANNEGIISRGSIDTLDDLLKLKNLRRISLAYQNIGDLGPLSELIHLEYIDLRHNPLEDVTPLSQLMELDSLILFDTNVSDLTALQGCRRLKTLDVGHTLVSSTLALDGLDTLQTLCIRKAQLRSLDGIKTLPMLEKIYLSQTPISDLYPLLELPRLQLVEIDNHMRTAAEAVAEQARFEIIYWQGAD
jgi:serine/threonine protein kinase